MSTDADTIEELVEFWDAGSVFYAADFWSLWDLGIIATGAAFFVVRMVALYHDNQKLTDTAYDILSIEALFLVPRYDVTGIPCSSSA